MIATPGSVKFLAEPGIAVRRLDYRRSPDTGRRPDEDPALPPVIPGVINTLRLAMTDTGTRADDDCYTQPRLALPLRLQYVLRSYTIWTLSYQGPQYPLVGMSARSR